MSKDYFETFWADCVLLRSKPVFAKAAAGERGTTFRCNGCAIDINNKTLDLLTKAYPVYADRVKEL